MAQGRRKEQQPRAEGPQNFADRICGRVLEARTRVCIGLDPDLARFPRELTAAYGLDRSAPDPSWAASCRRAAACIVEFNRRVLEAAGGFAAAMKPQCAYYEVYGPAGMAALQQTAALIREACVPVILDGKRNDIASTAARYAQAYLGADSGPRAAAIPADALTINAYLGSDGVAPFLDCCREFGRGLFVLVRTSNPSGGEIQEFPEGGAQTVARRMAGLVDGWGADLAGACGYSAVGAVVGATRPEAVAELRRLMPRALFLMPGFGAQGGAARDIAGALDSRGLGALVSASRSVLYPVPPETPAAEFFDAVARAAQDMRDAIEAVLPRA